MSRSLRIVIEVFTAGSFAISALLTALRTLTDWAPLRSSPLSFERTLAGRMAVDDGSGRLSLLVGVMPAPATAAPGKKETQRPGVLEAGIEPTGTGLVRPDFVSASVTARSAGERVEVLSERNEWSRSWVEPSGTVTVETLFDDVRFKGSSQMAVE